MYAKEVVGHRFWDLYSVEIAKFLGTGLTIVKVSEGSTSTNRARGYTCWTWKPVCSLIYKDSR